METISSYLRKEKKRCGYSIYIIMDEWYVIGEYVPEKMKPFSEKGRLGDIRGRPDAHDLNAVTERVKAILNV